MKSIMVLQSAPYLISPILSQKYTQLSWKLWTYDTTKIKTTFWETFQKYSFYVVKYLQNFIKFESVFANLYTCMCTRYGINYAGCYDFRHNVRYKTTVHLYWSHKKTMLCIWNCQLIWKRERGVVELGARWNLKKDSTLVEKKGCFYSTYTI